MGVRRVAALAVVLAIVSCDAPTVPSESPAYDPRLQGTDLVYHWPLGHTIAIYAHTTGAPAGLDLPAAIQRANALWRDAVRYREFDIRLASSESDADVVFHFDTDSVVSTAQCGAPGSGAGVTYFCLDQTLAYFVTLPLLSGAAGRVRFDVRIRASLDADTFERIVAHEFGHVIGIGNHSDVNTDLMFGAPTVDAPSAADAQTIRWVLHQETDIRP